EVEIGRLVAEVLAVHAGPDQAPVGVDVYLTDAELRGGQVLAGVHPRGILDPAPRGIDPGNFLLRHGTGAVHHEGEAGQLLLDRLHAVEVDALRAFELVGAVAGADGAGETVAVAALDELLRLIRIGEAGVSFVHGDVFLDTAQHAQLRLHAEAALMGMVGDAASGGDVPVERLVGGVDHHRGV